MKKLKIILDTNILFTALRSGLGASFEVISMIPSELFKSVISVPLAVEYEDVLKRHGHLEHLTEVEIDQFIDFIIDKSDKQEVHYLWRPFLKDHKDDMVLEVAVASDSDAIVTYNKKDFKNVEEKFGIKIIDAKELLEIIGVIK